MARVAVVPQSRRVAAASSEERLQLLEFLLATNDIAECAERSVEWLATHAGVRHALCAAVDANNTYLIGLAGYGLEPFGATDFRLDLDQRSHPIVTALSRLQPAVLPLNGHSESAGVPQLPYLAVPLHGRARQYLFLSRFDLRRHTSPRQTHYTGANRQMIHERHEWIKILRRSLRSCFNRAC